MLMKREEVGRADLFMSMGFKSSNVVIPAHIVRADYSFLRISALCVCSHLGWT